MLSFLALHTIAAPQGDGLHPRLVARLRRCCPRAPGERDLYRPASDMPARSERRVRSKMMKKELKMSVAALSLLAQFALFTAAKPEMLLQRQRGKTADFAKIILHKQWHMSAQFHPLRRAANSRAAQ